VVGHTRAGATCESQWQVNELLTLAPIDGRLNAKFPKKERLLLSQRLWE
jgi:hypothetical protein